jgi:hypothetical protein
VSRPGDRWTTALSELEGPPDCLYAQPTPLRLRTFAAVSGIGDANDTGYTERFDLDVETHPEAQLGLGVSGFLLI